MSDNRKPTDNCPDCALGAEEKWVSEHVYCNLCGHDWVACYEWNNTTRLECPNCHGASRINTFPEHAN